MLSHEDGGAWGHTHTHPPGAVAQGWWCVGTPPRCCHTRILVHKDTLVPSHEAGGTRGDPPPPPQCCRTRMVVHGDTPMPSHGDTPVLVHRDTLMPLQEADGERRRPGRGA